MSRSKISRDASRRRGFGYCATWCAGRVVLRFAGYYCGPPRSYSTVDNAAEVWRSFLFRAHSRRYLKDHQQPHSQFVKTKCLLYFIPLIITLRPLRTPLVCDGALFGRSWTDTYQEGTKRLGWAPPASAQELLVADVAGRRRRSCLTHQKRDNQHATGWSSAVVLFPPLGIDPKPCRYEVRKR